MDLPQSRLDSLYKDFGHLKELNPDGYRANIDTWKEYLTKNYLAHSDSLFLNCGPELLTKLRREPQGIPKSIDTVICSLLDCSSLIDPNDFYDGMMYQQERSTLLTWFSWRSWSKRKLNLRDDHKEYYLKDVQLMIRCVIEQKFEHVRLQLKNNIISKASGIADLVLSKQEFYRKCGFHRILNDAEQEREAMLFYLSHYKKLIVQSKDTVKIIAPEVHHILAHFEMKITEDDRRIGMLNASLTYVDLQIKTLQTQVLDYSTHLRDSIMSSAPKESQRRYLQAKKLVEKNLNRLLEQQANLATLKTQLNMAASNAILLRTLEESGKLLKSVNDSVGSVEKVEELLDQIKEQGERVEEVSALIAKSPDAADDAELDRELEMLETETGKAHKKGKVTEVSERENKDELLEQENEDLVKKLTSLNLGSKPAEPSERKLNSTQREPIAEF